MGLTQYHKPHFDNEADILTKSQQCITMPEELEEGRGKYPYRIFPRLYAFASSFKFHERAQTKNISWAK